MKFKYFFYKMDEIYSAISTIKYNICYQSNQTNRNYVSEDGKTALSYHNPEYEIYKILNDNVVIISFDENNNCNDIRLENINDFKSCTFVIEDNLFRLLV